MDIRFEDQNPTAVLYPDQFHAARRSQLMQYACEKGYVRKDQPTPSKTALLRIIEEGVVITDTAKIEKDDQAQDLNTAHEQAAPSVLVKENDEEEDLFGDEKSDEEKKAVQVILNDFLSTNNALALKKKFGQHFPDEPKFSRKAKKVDVLTRVKELLDLE